MVGWLVGWVSWLASLLGSLASEINEGEKKSRRVEWRTMAAESQNLSLATYDKPALIKK